MRPVIQVQDRVGAPVSDCQGVVVGSSTGFAGQACHSEPENPCLSDGLVIKLLSGNHHVGSDGFTIEIDGEVVGRKDLTEGQCRL